jgi:hypothetical protein
MLHVRFFDKFLAVGIFFDCANIIISQYFGALVLLRVYERISMFFLFAVEGERFLFLKGAFIFGLYVNAIGPLEDAAAEDGVFDGLPHVE